MKPMGALGAPEGTGFKMSSPKHFKEVDKFANSEFSPEESSFKGKVLE